MIVRFADGTSEDVVHALRVRLESEGLRTLRSPQANPPVLAVPGKVPEALVEELRRSPDIAEVLRPSTPGYLVHRAFRDGPSQVEVGTATFGGGSVAVIAGPCSVEGRDAMLDVARRVRDAGAHVLRGGAFKPRTSPYSFQGFGVEGLRQLKDAGEAVGLPVISEVMDASHLPAFLDHDIDCLQVGARNMQNFTLLQALAGAGRPVLLKRGPAATVNEWLSAAEHLAAAGCEHLILCERGIRTFEPATRHTLDLTVLPLLREWTHLPVVVDPSHAAGIASIIPPLARAALAAGADGLALEMHPDPSHAFSDGPQALLPGELTRVVADARVLAAVDGRHLCLPPERPGGRTGHRES